MARDTTREGYQKKRRSRRKGGLCKVNDIFSKTLKRLNVQTKFDEFNIQKHYESIFGKEISKVSFPEKLINGNLYITVSSSAWLQALTFEVDNFKEKIAKRFNNRRLVLKITFKVGKVKKHEVRAIFNEWFDLRGVCLDDETKESIEKSVKDIKDQDLRKSIISAKSAESRNNYSSKWLLFTLQQH
ncbi:DUF721 domain-containing protein [Thermodesulfobacteriota bacterium]